MAAGVVVAIGPLGAAGVVDVAAGRVPAAKGCAVGAVGAAALGVVGGSAPDIMGPVGHAQTAIGTPIWPGGVTMYCAGITGDMIDCVGPAAKV